MSIFFFFLQIFCILLSFIACQESRASNESVLHRSLIKKEDIDVKSIINNHAFYCEPCTSIKSFYGNVLGYVTPWNNHGYDVAKIFTTKFNYVSPVWLQLRRVDGVFLVTGQHDIDLDWIASLRKSSSSVHVVPRLIVEFAGMDDVNSFFDPVGTKNIITVVMSLVDQYSFDGVVLEIWSQFGGHYKSELTNFIRRLSDSLRAAEKIFVLVIPPALTAGSLSPGMFVQQDFEALVEYVTAFSLMTYDYSSVARPGPNAPIKWIEDCVKSVSPNEGAERGKILLGLNMYGNDYSSPQSGGPILAHQFLDVVRKMKKGTLRWKAGSAEHVLFYKRDNSKHQMWFPSLGSIAERVGLARNLGTGLSLWELGQGLDYFYDVF